MGKNHLFLAVLALFASQYGHASAVIAIPQHPGISFVPCPLQNTSRDPKETAADEALVRKKHEPKLRDKATTQAYKAVKAECAEQHGSLKITLKDVLDKERKELSGQCVVAHVSSLSAKDDGCYQLDCIVYVGGECEIPDSPR